MDINLPGLSGYDALAILKNDPNTAHIPILALTANAVLDEQIKGLNAGFSEYLSKPLDLPMLVNLIKEHLPALPAQ